MTARRFLVPALMASLLAACGDDEQPTPNDCTEKGTFIRIDSPADGELLTTDVNGTRPNFQATVTAETDLPDGRNVQVIVNGDVAADTVTVASGKIETQVTLLTGANTVVLSATVCDKPVKGAVAVSVAPDGCEFVKPVEGVQVEGGQDTDPSRAGVQMDVVARCKVFEQGQAATLRFNATEVGQGTFDAQGAVTFPGVSFYPGQVDVAMWQGGEKKLASKFDVSIEGECPVSLEPVPDTMFNVGGDVSEVWPNARGDADVDTPGIQADFTVTTDCESPTRAHINDRSGVELGVADFEAGKAVVRVLVPEGDFGLWPTVEASGKVQPGNPAGYHSDSIVPACVIEVPANGGAAEDTDPVTGDVQFTIRGRCTDLEPGATVELRIAQASSGPLNTTAKTEELAEDGTFAFDWSVVAGDYKAWVGGARPSGNRSPSTVNVNRFVAGVPNCAVTEPMANLATGNRTLEVKVKSNVDPGVDITILVTDPDGEEQAQTVTAQPSPAGGTQATATVTLADKEGVHEIGAQCGASGAATPVPVQYDLTSPVLTLQLPGSGFINQAIGDANPGTAEFDLLVTVTADLIQDGSTGEVTFTCIPSGAASTTPVPLSFTANKAEARVSLAAVPEGDNCTFTATATDLAGNPATPSSAAAIYDRVGPVIVSSFPAGGFELVGSYNPRINGTTIIGNPVLGDVPKLSFNFETTGAVGGRLTLEDPATQTVFAEQSVAPDGIVFMQVVPLPQGRSLNIDVRLTDSAGNVTTRQFPATIDVISPAVPTNLSLRIDDHLSAAGTLTFDEPSGDAGAEGAVSTFDVAWSPLTNLEPITVFTDARTGAFAAPPLPAGTGNSVEASISFPPMGDKQACVRAIDAVGNVGPGACASASSSWTDTSFISDQNTKSLGGYVVALPSVDGDSIPDLAVAEFGRSNGVASGGVMLFSGDSDLATALAEPRQVVFGTLAGERCGTAMATGDFDGDGTADLVVGCPRANSNRGRVMVYFGGVTDVDGDGANDGFSETVRSIVDGPSGMTAFFGNAVAAVGDLDGDGRDEVFVSNSSTGAAAPGEAYVLFGRTRAAWGTATVLDASAVEITGETNGDLFGYRWGATGVGDIDGDGTPDVMIPASAVNKAYIFSGADIVTPPVGGLDAGDATVLIEDAASAPGTTSGSPGFGHRSVGNQDVTGDSFVDLIIADAFNGKIRVYKGNDAGNAFDSTATQTLEFPSAASYRYGYALAMGDLTGDGVPDLFVGGNAAATATFFVYRGKDPAADAPFETVPGKVGAAGTTVLGVAGDIVDLDGDGTNELVVGAPLDGNGGFHVYSVP